MSKQLWGQSRRDFLVCGAASLGAIAAAPMFAQNAGGGSAERAVLTPTREKDADSLAIPSDDQLAWQDLEIGMFVHFAPNTWQDKEGDDLSTPLDLIDPDIDTDNWAECAVHLGARYIVFVAKHAGGFCMWNTETTPYSIGHTRWKAGRGDVLRDLSASCNKYGLQLGVYLSPRDDNFGAGTGGVCKDSGHQATYNSLYRAQLTEVLARYGKMVEVWFDGSSVVPTSDLVRRYAPHAAIFQGPDATIRWVGNENGFAPYPLWNAVSEADARSGVSTASHGDSNGEVWLPVESDISIRRPYWFWSTTNERNLLTLDQLLEVYYRSVGRGSQLLLNIPADRRGHMPDADFARAREFGAEIRRRFGKSVAEASNRDGRLELHFAEPASIDHVVLQEDCRFGQRIRAFRVEGFAGNQWLVLGTGTTIGHKRILPVIRHELSDLRLLVTETEGEPHIRLAVFSTQAAPPSNWDASTLICTANDAGS